MSVQTYEVIFRIRRYSPEKGSYWQEYKLTVDRFTQFTEALRRIKTEQDPSLAYRASCHMAVCGSCGMKINGEPRLACKTLVSGIINKYGSNVITIEPMDYFPVIKDLIVDWEDFYTRMFKVKPRLYPAKEVLEGKGEHRLKPEDQRRLWKFAQCIWCGLCVSVCPVIREDPEFLGPAAHAKGYRFLTDPRDTITDERFKILSDSAWRCTYCYHCFSVCPRDIEPVTAIKKTRALTKYVKEPTNVTFNGVKHSEAIAGSIKTTGKIMESLVYLQTYGLSRSLKDLIFIAKAGRGGSLISSILEEKPVKNVSEIKKLFEG
ncbi:MAG: succinate dehydrogenase/fumarate reductase iron-sulfur subunit [Sulfolobaceae archaeon]|nr:succinate dehydrogenase/fumarate reductase iron-sulfur subunit [Sulfolobaceae archaeon]